MILNWGLMFFKISNWLVYHQLVILKNANPQFKITNWSFYHQVVISTFSSLLLLSAQTSTNPQIPIYPYLGVVYLNKCSILTE